MTAPESASPNDTDYLLRYLGRTPFRFSIRPRTAAPSGDHESAIFAFVRSHPRVTVKDIQTHVPALRDLSYNEARNLVVRLVETGVLRTDGRASLEQVDDLYERVPACDLCGSPSEGHKTVLWKYNTPVVKCSGCGLLYANPRWKAEHLFGRYTEEYWAQYADKIRHTALDPAANQARWDPYLASLELARNNGRLLDVGCATGEFLFAAKERGWQVHGVETSPVAAAQATRLTGAQVHVGTLDTAPYPKGWFDVVTLWDVLEHVQSPRAYVEQIARLVRTGGMLALTTPNIRSLAYRLLGRDWWVIGPNDHLYYFAPRTLVRLLNDCGFAVHAMHTMDMTPSFWSLWLRRPWLQGFAAALRIVTKPVVDRLLLGDALYIVARRLS